MDANLTGQIHATQVAHPKSVRRFAEKQIRRWVDGLKSRTQTVYQVRFNREANGHFFTCYVEIRAGAQRWTGSAYARDLQQALIQCLRHMGTAAQPASKPSAARLALAST